MPPRRRISQQGGRDPVTQTKLSRFFRRPQEEEASDDEEAGNVAADEPAANIKEEVGNVAAEEADEGVEEEVRDSKKPSIKVETEQEASIKDEAPAPSPEEKKASGSVRIIEQTGSIFTQPMKAVLVHACNGVGTWGSGIAADFKKKYPEAFKDYKKYCSLKAPDELRGTAHLIGPSEQKPGKARHYVGCLFTSRGTGKHVDSPQAILDATGPALQDLLRKITKVKKNGQTVGDINMCRINSGLFAVPWDKTKDVIEKLTVESDVDIVVWRN